MSAEPEARHTITVTVSERDSDDGITVNKAIRSNTYKESEIASMVNLANVFKTEGIVANASDTDFPTAAVVLGKNSVVEDVHDTAWTFTIRSGKTQYASGSWDKIYDEVLPTDRDIQVEISLFYDQSGADQNSSIGLSGDGEVDDREQTFYNVYLETSVGSGYYHPAVTYVTDKGDDLVKLVNDGEYENLPGLESDTEKNGKYYVYEYTVDGDDIYGNWVEYDEKDENRFASSEPENTLDKDGDGIVTCDEYYGVTGLKWDDKKNACVTTSGNAVVTVPDTSAR